MALNLSPPAPYLNTDCSAFSGTTWVATIVGTQTNPVRTLLIDMTCDQDLEFGYTSGTGDTATFYVLAGPRAVTIDLPAPLGATLYVRRRKNGTTPTASTKLTVSALA